MIFKNKKINKVFASFIIILIIMPSVLLTSPSKAHAIPVEEVGPVGWFNKLTSFFTAKTAVEQSIDTTLHIKDFAKEVLREVLRAFARKLLTQMTQATVAWINSGFHGSPLFVERPGAFFKDIGKYEIKKLVQILGYDTRKYPFGKSIAINTIESYKRQFEINAQYSLNKVIRDQRELDRYRNNFSAGGWNGFLINTRPQNNYVGFYLLSQDELARRLQGTAQNEAEGIRDTLQQGLGFLSPQTCPSNPKYNNLKNQFNQPNFKPSKPAPKFTCGEVPPSTDTAAYEAYNKCEELYRYNEVLYESEVLEEQAKWNETNSCPGGLVSTTPGSVVASQITNALGTSFRTTELGTAMGNSLSAIFDALLNKFLSTGLNALGNKISGNGGNNDRDDFDYYGHSLGTTSNGGTTSGGLDWNGADENIILSDFKREVQNAIDNANKELKFITNSDPNVPGFLQLFDVNTLRTQELDTCLPGPNFDWESRVDSEVQRKNSTEAVTTLANSYKSWLPDKIRAALPSSAEFFSSVNSIKKTNETRDALRAREDIIRNTLVKLESIKTGLSSITTQPVKGSEAEKNMVRLKQRMLGMLVDLSTGTSVAEAQNNLDDIKDNINNLNLLTTKCTNERQTKGWSNPGGATSTLGAEGTEKDIFCTSFVNTTLSCDAIFKTSTSDYNIQGVGTVNGGVNSPNIPNESTTKLGTCIKGLTIKRDITENECSTTLPGGVWVVNTQ